jgi:DNA segregation ATPase FtsK/SpoIIIE-like protein
MVHNREIMAVTEFLRNQQKVEYNPYFSDFSDPEAKAAEAAAKNGGAAPTNVNLKEDSFETVYLYVRDAIMAMDATSISRIQRDFRVGYPRASEIFNKLIEDGIVAPKTDAPNSSKPCQVLVHSLEELNGGTPAQTGPGSVSSSYTEPAGIDDFS